MQLPTDPKHPSPWVEQTQGASLTPIWPTKLVVFFAGATSADIGMTWAGCEDSTLAPCWVVDVCWVGSDCVNINDVIVGSENASLFALGLHLLLQNSRRGSQRRWVNLTPDWRVATFICCSSRTRLVSDERFLKDHRKVPSSSSHDHD